MTRHCSKNISPDSITGMIFAMEGMKKTVVLLNGPMGCKFYHSTTSQFLAVRPRLYLPAEQCQEGEDIKKVPVDYNYLNSWFFRQPRVPCTYLDSYDYVYGTADKVREGLLFLRKHVDFDLIAIVNSPGASLIGDNLKELAGEILPDRLCVMLESPGYSQDFASGYEAAALETLKQVGAKLWKGIVQGTEIPEEKVSEKILEAKLSGRQAFGSKSVNLLGLSIWQRYLDGDLAELTRLFALCGIKINCCLAAGNSLGELKNLPNADLNVVLYPEMGRECAEFLSQTLGMNCYICDGPPIGFKATESMLQDICRLLEIGNLPEGFVEESEKARAMAWYKINDIYQMCGLPKGVTFAVEGMDSEVYAYSRFFMEYLGMIPDCLSLIGEREPQMRERLETLLEIYHAGCPQKKDILETKAELVFGNANTIAALKTGKRAFCGIEISLPGMGYVDVVPKTHLGIKGALFLTEQVLNGLMSKI